MRFVINKMCLIAMVFLLMVENIHIRLRVDNSIVSVWYLCTIKSLYNFVSDKTVISQMYIVVVASSFGILYTVMWIYMHGLIKSFSCAVVLMYTHMLNLNSYLLVL